MTLSIPNEKLSQLRSTAASWTTKVSASKRDLQSLIGKFSWAAKCVKAIRPCLRSLIDLQKPLKRQSHRVRLPAAVRLDLQYFAMWCVRFNGVALIPSTAKSLPQTSLYTDASQTAGAAYYNTDFVYSCWAQDCPNIAGECIHVKELCAVLLAFRRWAPVWAHQHILV